MLQAILGFLGIIPAITNTINGITQAISNEKIAALKATTDQDRIAAEERVTALQAQRDVLIADSAHSNLDIWVRTIIASGPTAYLTKVFLYDKVLAWGSTDNLTDIEWQVVMVVVGFYFLHSFASIWAKSK